MIDSPAIPTCPSLARAEGRRNPRLQMRLHQEFPRLTIFTEDPIPKKRRRWGRPEGRPQPSQQRMWPQSITCGGGHGSGRRGNLCGCRSASRTCRTTRQSVPTRLIRTSRPYGLLYRLSCSSPAFATSSLDGIDSQRVALELGLLVAQRGHECLLVTRWVQLPTFSSCRRDARAARTDLVCL